MLKRKSYLVLAAATFATLPVATRAATITFSYDAADMQVSSDGGNTFGPAVFNPATNTVTVPAGDIVEFGVDVTVTGNANPAATGTTGAGTYNNSKHSQPATLGLAAYGFGMTDSSATTANVVDSAGPGAGGTTTSSAGAADASWEVHVQGNVDDNGGGILTTGPESGGVLVGNHASSGTAATNAGLFGVGGSGAAEILNGLQISANKGGTAVFTPTDQVGPGNLAIVTYLSGGSSTTAAGAPKYAPYTIQPGDGNTVNNLPALTLDVIGVTPTASPIVNLTAQGSQLADYTNTLPLLHVTGHNGSYTPAYDHNVNNANGVAEVTGFSPANDAETYALKLAGLSSNSNTAAAQIATIITDINANSATDGVLAVLPTPDVAALAPGYQIELTATSTSADQSLGFDFTQETNVAGVTVTDVMAVPEPASIGLLMGASGLLLGRRKRKA